MKLKDRIALVTGGGSGIGQATAQLFAEEGARVIVNDVNLAAARKTVESPGAGLPGARAVQADVSDSHQVNAMFAEIEREFGTLDILVNNAGIAETAPGEAEMLREKTEAWIGEMLSEGGRRGDPRARGHARAGRVRAGSAGARGCPRSSCGCRRR